MHSTWCGVGAQYPSARRSGVHKRCLTRGMELLYRLTTSFVHRKSKEAYRDARGVEKMQQTMLIKELEYLAYEWERV